MVDLDVLVFGGGAAGLWTLDALRRAGWAAALLEARALGSGQTIQSQGIIHGGGKYALKGVRDLEAVRTIRGMPGLWRDCRAGKAKPDLGAARILSERCLLWLPRSGVLGDMKAKGLMAIVVNAGLLATKPVELKKADWPSVLRESALRVYAMAEPVFDTGSVLAALAAPHAEAIRGCDAEAVSFREGVVRAGGLELRPRAVVLAAGAGNERLMQQAGAAPGGMQRRPLRMVLLRGASLPELFGHCVVGGKTHLTVTSARDGAGRTVWQVGGEIAERTANEPDSPSVRKQAVEEVSKWLPALDWSGVEIATYAAVRAEASTAGARRPSGVHVQRVAEGPPTFVAWPTKLALAPVLAEEVAAQVAACLGKPAGYNPRLPGGAPAVAPYPWEEAAWSAAR